MILEIMKIISYNPVINIIHKIDMVFFRVNVGLYFLRDTNHFVVECISLILIDRIDRWRFSRWQPTKILQSYFTNLHLITEIFRLYLLVD